MAFVSLPPSRRKPLRGRRRLVVLLVGALVVELVAAGSSRVAAQGPTSFTMTGGGFGHGVGMSQYGAKGRADAGQSAAEILGFYYPGTALTATNPGGPRVKLADSAAPEIVSAAGVLTAQPEGGAAFTLANPGERMAFRTSGTEIYARRIAPTPGDEVLVANGVPLFVTWTAGARLDLSSSGYGYDRGRLVIRPKSGTLEMVLDSLTMDGYLYGLGEVPSSWPSAALEAQAIAGRSYAAHRLANPQSTTFDIYASTQDQAFVGANKSAGPQGERWVAAVDATTGSTLTYSGTTIQAFYSSSNGGASEGSGYVWATSYPYFVAAGDSFDATPSNPNANWTETYSGDELGAWLAAAGRGDVGSVTGISVGGNVGASGRVDKATVTVTGPGGTITMTGNQLRSAINARAVSNRDLLSTKFAISGAPAAPPPPPPPESTPPFGQFQFAVPFANSHLIVAGWVVDQDAPRNPTTLLMTVDGRVAAGGVANLTWPTLAGNPTYGADHGFFLAAPGGARSHKVCVFAIDQGGTKHTLMGCRDITRPAPRRAARRRR